MKRLIALALGAAAAWFHFAPLPAPFVAAAPPPVSLRPGSAEQPPLQRAPEAPATFEVNGYEVRALQAFALKARVLSVERYRTGREAELSPIDMALGWGRMADPAVSGQLEITQGG